MSNYDFKLSNGNRDHVIEYIKAARMNDPSFTVVDVGGSMNSWAAQYVDSIVDFVDCPNADSKIRHFKCDITDPDSWHEIMKHVDSNGKFDFCICTHTLEDIMNPEFVSRQIAKIAKSGYIAVPSKHRELARFENGRNTYRGYIHHRWIFDIIDNVFVGFPKINYIDSNDAFDRIANVSEHISDLSFFWKDTIDIRYVNNNYLGPSVHAVIGYYNELLNDNINCRETGAADDENFIVFNPPSKTTPELTI